MEPGTTVLAIGTIQNVNFYRTVTKDLGVHDYLAKPLRPETVADAFRPIIVGRQPAPLCCEAAG